LSEMQTHTGRNVGLKECAIEKPLCVVGKTLRLRHEYSGDLRCKHFTVDLQTAMLEQHSLRATN